MPSPGPDQIEVSDIIDSLRAAGMAEENIALDQMAAALQALAEAGHAAWAQVEGLLDDPDALAAYLRQQALQAAETAEAGGDHPDRPETPADPRG